VIVNGVAPRESSASKALRGEPVSAPAKIPIVGGVTSQDRQRAIALPGRGRDKVDGRNEIEVTVERRPAADQNTLDWIPEPQATVAQTGSMPVIVPQAARRGPESLWRGTITLPEAGASVAYRLVVKEYEVFYADEGGSLNDTRVDRRVVYADAIEL
jgi:hypothetical protein